MHGKKATSTICLWCFLCLQVSKPQIIRLLKKKKKKKKTQPKVYRLCGPVEKELYGLQFTLRLWNESRGDSMWKNFGLPCGTVKNKKSDQPLEKGILSGKREKKKVCIIYLCMHEQLSHHH